LKQSEVKFTKSWKLYKTYFEMDVDMLDVVVVWMSR
jgi:hypothetical protein